MALSATLIEVGGEPIRLEGELKAAVISARKHAASARLNAPRISSAGPVDLALSAFQFGELPVEPCSGITDLLLDVVNIVGLEA